MELKRWLGYLRKTAVILPSVPLIGLGVACYRLADMGTDPFTGLQIGVSMHTGLSVGTVSLIMNLTILFAFIFIDRKMIGVGSVVFSLGVGPSIDLFSTLLRSLFPNPLPLWAGLISIAVGTCITGFALANYLHVKLGIQAPDMLSILIGERLLKKSYGIGRILFNILVFVFSLILGAPWGFGTLCNVFLVSIVVDFLSPRIKKFSCALAGIAPESEPLTAAE